MYKVHLTILVFIVAIFYQNSILAQNPTIKGTVKLSIKKRTIECDLNYTGLTNYSSILLFNGLPKPAIIDENGKKISLKRAKQQIGEKSIYNFAGTDKAPVSFNVKYKSKQKLKHRIISKYTDWKGNIAYDGNSIRATEQSAWYPVLYDAANSIINDEFIYDVEVVCEDCKTIYMNGSQPVADTKAHLKSTLTVPLTLYAGNVDFKLNNGTYFINSTLNSFQENIISNHFDKAKQFYENKLKIKYGTDISIISTNPSDNKKNWMFVSFPTIVIIGNKENAIERYINSNNESALDSLRATSLTHEAGHYYFGKLLKPNNALFWVFLEGFNEYISLKANQQILGNYYYNLLIKNYITRCADLKVTPISQIQNSSEIGINYRYFYVPMLLSAIEKEIGEEAMWRWMQVLISKDKDTQTDYALFKSTMLEAGVDKSKFLEIETRYINADNAKDNVTSKIQIQ